MPQAKAVIEIYDPTTEITSVRSFARSPVLIGSSPRSSLRLDDADVAPIHGELWFGQECLAFGNLASKTWLNGEHLELGTFVPLADDATLIVGMQRLKVYRLNEWPAEVQFEPAMVPASVVQVSDFWPPKSTKFLARALAVLTEFADALVDLKKDVVFPACSALNEIGDPDELLAYLLDPSSPDARIDELRGDLDALVRRTSRLDLSRHRGWT